MRTSPVLFVLVLGCASLTAQERDPSALLALEKALQTSVDEISPFVVSIETFGGLQREARKEDKDADAPAKPKSEGKERPGAARKPLRRPGFLQAQGTSTGLLISSDGWIVISRFALNYDPSTILVGLPDGRSFAATRGGEDSSRGIALIKIEAEDLPVPEFLDPAEVRVGQWAFVLGRTFGKDSPSVHMGIVSAKSRIFGRAVQVDAYTSPANYGGPVMDLRGRVIGVSVPLSPAGRDAGADWYDSGIGFAATIADIPEIITRLKAGEVLHRGWLGISSSPQHLGPGALVASIAAGSPARGIGLEPGDMVLSVDDKAVINPFHLQVLLGSRLAGEPLHLRYQRGKGELLGVTVFLAEQPAADRRAQSKEKEAFQLPWEQEKKDKDR